MSGKCVQTIALAEVSWSITICPTVYPCNLTLHKSSSSTSRSAPDDVSTQLEPFPHFVRWVNQAMWSDSTSCRVLQGTTVDQPAAIHQGNKPVSQQAEGETVFQPEDTIQLEACQVLEKVQKQLSNEAVRHITREKVMYKPMDTAISNIHSSDCKPKSWELNYPALAFN